MEEIWKDIPDYSGLYQASSLGRIKSMERRSLMPRNGEKATRRRRELILKPMRQKDGYYHHVLYKNGNSKNYQTHFLIWITFHGIDYDNSVFKIDHIDDNQINNNASNLQLLRSGENIGKGYQAKGKTTPTGISFINGKFIARIQINKKSIYLGSSVELNEAIQLRNNATKIYYTNDINSLKVKFIIT